MTDKSLAEETRYLRSALNRVGYGLCVFDAQAQLLVCNQRFLRMYGLATRQAPVGSSYVALLQKCRSQTGIPGDVESWVRQLQGYLTQGRARSSSVDLADGRIFVITEGPVEGGGFVSTHTDVTKQHRAKRELDRTRAILNTVVDNMPAP